MNADLLCPECGFLLDRPAWSDAGGSFEICPSCGIQFGYTDAAGGDPGRRAQLWLEWRARSTGQGCPWNSVGRMPPAAWDPSEQVARVASGTAVAERP